MKRLIYSVLTFVVLLMLGYFIVLNLPKASSKNKEAVHSVAAKGLFQEFENNEAGANKKYIGKTIEVKGIIGSIEKDKKGATVLVLETDDMLSGVLCTLEGNVDMDKYKKGSEVTVKGLCTGYLMDVVLNKCIIQP